MKGTAEAKGRPPKRRAPHEKGQGQKATASPLRKGTFAPLPRTEGTVKGQWQEAWPQEKYADKAAGGKEGNGRQIKGGGVLGVRTGGPLGAFGDEAVSAGHGVVLDEDLPKVGVPAEDGADVADRADGVRRDELGEKLVAQSPHVQPDADVACTPAHSMMIHITPAHSMTSKVNTG